MRRRDRWRRLLALACACATVTGLAQERHRERTHDGGATSGPALRDPHGATAPAAIARLRLLDTTDGHAAQVENLLAGPVQVQVEGRSRQRIDSSPPLPARATLAAGEDRIVVRLAPGRFDLFLDTVPGAPHARVEDVEYAYPLQTAALRVQQAWGGGFSHHAPDSRHAVDFAAPVGTGVLAAREGTVMQTESRFGDAAPGDPEAMDRANLVRILHDDGSMAVYAHLQAGGVLVRPGQRVRRGERIGLSGNTGFSTGPHLHFVVQANRGMRLESVPFRMAGPQGPLRFGRPR